MTPTKQFFNKRTLTLCLVFSLLLSVLSMWRFTHSRGIPFFSAQAAKVYAVFVVIDYAIILLVFFIIFWQKNRK